MGVLSVQTTTPKTPNLPIPPITPETVAKNWVILTVMGCFTLLLFIGLYFFVMADIRESQTMTTTTSNHGDTSESVVVSDKNKDISNNNNNNNEPVKAFEKVIANITPIEYNRNLRWTQRFWSKMTTDHDLISVFAKYNAEGDYRAAKWLMLFVFIFNFLLVDTIIAIIFFVDNGQCGKHVSQTSCTQQYSVDQINPICSWASTTSTCAFNTNIGADVLSAIILAVIIAVVSIPLNMICYYAICEFRNFMGSTYMAKKKSKDVISEQLDLDGLQTEATTMFRLVVYMLCLNLFLLLV